MNSKYFSVLTWGCLLLALPAAALANTITNANWVTMNAALNGSVHIMEVDKAGNLYIAGNFTTVGDVSANYIAKWNGSAWSALGSGTGSPPYALAVDSAGNLYAGGDFSVAGGSMVHNIAKWNGSTWSALRYGLNGTVMALVADKSGSLYVGGSFRGSYDGTVEAQSIAKWGGYAWSAVGSNGLRGTISAGSIYSLILDGNGNLYAAGGFDSADVGVAASNVAKWNGTKWSGLGAGLNDLVLGLALDRTGNLYAGGTFTFSGSSAKTVNRIAKWNGSTWSPLGSGVNTGNLDNVSALVVDGSNNLYIGGAFTSVGGLTGANRIAQWSSNAWSAMGSGLDSAVFDMKTDGNGNLYVAGSFKTAGEKSSPYLAKVTIGSPNRVIGEQRSCAMPFATSTQGAIYSTDGRLLWTGSFTSSERMDQVETPKRLGPGPFIARPYNKMPSLLIRSRN